MVPGGRRAGLPPGPAGRGPRQSRRPRTLQGPPEPGRGRPVRGCPGAAGRAAARGRRRPCRGRRGRRRGGRAARAGPIARAALPARAVLPTRPVRAARRAQRVPSLDPTRRARVGTGASRGRARRAGS
ncbi:hypothetical protein DEJ01_00610 [Curtobacterium sp. MCLR17_040]|nr:hypothetical protein DEJ01_00610 [Curtobacterium sp. MCLR17_040]